MGGREGGREGGRAMGGDIRATSEDTVDYDVSGYRRVSKKVRHG